MPSTSDLPRSRVPCGPALLVVALALLPGCLLGIGRSSVASKPLGASQSTEVVVDRVENGVAYGHEEAGPAFWGGLPIGVYGVALPTLLVNAADGVPFSVSGGWAYGVGGQASLGPFGIAADYVYRSTILKFAGDFGVGQELQGPSFYGAYAPVGWLGLEVGGGPLWGRIGAGGRGSGMDIVATDAQGYRLGGRANVFLTAGGYLQMQSVVRVEAGWQSVSANDPRLPRFMNAATLGVGLALSFF